MWHVMTLTVAGARVWEQTTRDNGATERVRTGGRTSREYETVMHVAHRPYHNMRAYTSIPDLSMVCDVQSLCSRAHGILVGLRTDHAVTQSASRRPHCQRARRTTQPHTACERRHASRTHIQDEGETGQARGDREASTRAVSRLDARRLDHSWTQFAHDIRVMTCHVCRAPCHRSPL
jgi:hypothetical protein